MIPVIAGGGSSFAGAFDYYFHDKGAKTTARVAWTQTRNMLTDCVEKAWKVMAYTAKAHERLKEASGQKRTGRKLEKPVFAYSLSWHPEQKPDKETMLKAAQLSLEKLGLAEYEAMISAHRDEPQPHIHLIVNRIHPLTGIAAKINHSKRKLSDFAREWEHSKGKVYCMEREKNHQKRLEGQNTKHIDPAYALAWNASKDAKGFADTLAAKGYEIAKGRSRLVVVDPFGKSVNPVRQLPEVRAKEFQERMGGIDLNALSTPEEILKKRTAKTKEQHPKTDAYEEQVALAIADQMTRHQDEWSDFSAHHARIMDRERGKLSSYYRMRETAFKIESVKAKLDAPKLLPGFARKFLRLDERLENQLEALNATQANARQRMNEALGKFEKEREVVLQSLKSRQTVERQELAARLAKWKPAERSVGKDFANSRNGLDVTRESPDQQNGLGR